MHTKATKEKENKKEKENAIDKASENEKPASCAEKTGFSDDFVENPVENLWNSVDNFF